ncbi:DNA-3-methyladenine glycosylase 1 [Asticcacaulis biprosthecium C19]|uniref:DNA-3-methyladenine glycosylase II n=1 Tax=Asticcacaulis biprosthecium C19 TaxID=715226 RepID=F4QIF5_9CAUL|nr:DNA-3-methyladenine glycosylase [Asticcacaulis biprosthecium]EGF92944.1 DNA-3-methyladenine glycosylase 1 [Asticcacaulis biprosthecium C19]
MTPLDPAHLAHLAEADPKLKPLTERFGHIQYRLRESGFPALLRLIVEQQLSVKAADTIVGRLHAGLTEVSPQALLAHDVDLLRGYGLSRPKIAYARALAEAIHGGVFDTESLTHLDIEAAADKLLALKGVGRWTAEVYLMFSEGRLDLFPVGDIALREALGWLDQRDARPDEKYSAERARIWSPYRSVASHLLWAWYGAVKRGEASREL